MRQRILNWILRNYLKAVVFEDVITTEGKLKLGGEPIEVGQRNSFRIEARTIQDMQLWRSLRETLKQKAHESMFSKSRSWEDMFFGKALLYNLDLIEKHIQFFAQDEKKPLQEMRPPLPSIIELEDKR